MVEHHRIIISNVTQVNVKKKITNKQYIGKYTLYTDLPDITKQQWQQ